jgi:hypothetical protein
MIRFLFLLAAWLLFLYGVADGIFGFFAMFMILENDPSIVGVVDWSDCVMAVLSGCGLMLVNSYTIDKLRYGRKDG